MHDFKALKHDVRADALVGHFLQEWAFLESDLDNVVVKALGLKPLQGAIVTNNLQFRDKIHVARAALNLQPNYQKEARGRLEKRLKNLAKFAENRNLLAHHAFGPSNQSDGVAFIIVRARGVLKIPKIDWSVATFENHYKEMQQFSNDLRKIEEFIEAAHPVDAKSLVVRTIVEALNPTSTGGDYFSKILPTP